MKLKNRIIIYAGITGLLFYFGCKKENSQSSTNNQQNNSTTTTTKPGVSTSAISAITTTTANGGGNVSSSGGENVTARGICWSTGNAPTLANSSVSGGLGTGSFTASLTGLTKNTTYYVRAYAT